MRLDGDTRSTAICYKTRSSTRLIFFDISRDAAQPNYAPSRFTMFTKSECNIVSSTQVPLGYISKNIYGAKYTFLWFATTRSPDKRGPFSCQARMLNFLDASSAEPADLFQISVWHISCQAGPRRASFASIFGLSKALPSPALLGLTPHKDSHYHRYHRTSFLVLLLLAFGGSYYHHMARSVTTCVT